MLQLLEDVVALKAENAALREEIARLKGLKGPPKLKPSGMEKATEPARAERKAGRRGGKIDRLVIDEERVLKAAVPPGSRFYADLKAYCRDPTPRRKRELQARFDRLFTTTTGFATLDRLLARLHANKIELLRALERPDIPLHTNGSENDIRCQVTRRKISGGTRSETGRDCRDAFLGLMKTCDKLGVSFWDYLGSRLDIPGAPPILPLPDLIRQRAAA